MFIQQFFFFLAWLGALWQRWTGMTAGCFSIGRLALLHCWAGSPLLYLMDLAVVIFLVLGLPFLVFSNTKLR